MPGARVDDVVDENVRREVAGQFAASLAATPG
jgi:hypothetical protein